MARGILARPTRFEQPRRSCSRLCMSRRTNTFDPARVASVRARPWRGRPGHGPLTCSPAASRRDGVAAIPRGLRSGSARPRTAQPWPPLARSVAKLPSCEVYDVTKFLEDHPGGDDVLLSSTGKDATDDFEDVGGHSNTARAMMDEYLVGEVDDPF
ncbi:Cytochrome B5 isoform D [Zea mays]|uniref:Cytochrome B5 isoform D n=1 Tax=Zea mays TaxID=4577 RepID=A0A1D6LHW0_MAIZE|nr:Cytochrome B5 isoform D [Zea mays]